LSHCNAGCEHSQAGLVNYRDPMVVTPALHDTSSKTLLIGAQPVVPAGPTPDRT
jgi:hypothetical protein